jgi:hypothetical protein
VLMLRYSFCVSANSSSFLQIVLYFVSNSLFNISLIVLSITKCYVVVLEGDLPH